MHVNMMLARECARLCHRWASSTHQRLHPAFITCHPLFFRPAAPRLSAPSQFLHSLRQPAPTVCQAYADPEVYDIAFSFRLFEQEAAYLLAAYHEHCTGPLKRTIEIGCGPARHSILIAQSAGTSGAALDISQGMLDYAAKKAEAAGVAERLTLIKADMTTPFAEGVLQAGGAADMALVLLGTLAHCLDNAAAANCFQEVAKLVRPGGLLVLELPHPEELFSGEFYTPAQFVDAWDAAAGDKAVLVEWGREGDEFDARTQVLERTVGMSLYEGQELVSSHVQRVAQRQFTFQEIDLLGRLSGFEVVGVQGDFNSNISLEHEDAYRMIVCLRRLQH